MRFKLCLAIILSGGWNSAVFAQSTKARAAEPLGNPGAWVTPADYPTSALRGEIAGTAGFQLTIDRTGAVSSCIITSSSGSPLLDETTCRLIHERARFKPASDASGKPTIGTFSNRIRWVIPTAPLLPTSGRVVTEHTVEADGTVTGCKIVAADNATFARMAENTMQRCQTLRYARPSPETGSKPARLRVRTTFSIELSEIKP